MKAHHAAPQTFHHSPFQRLNCVQPIISQPSPHLPVWQGLRLSPLSVVISPQRSPVSSFLLSLFLPPPRMSHHMSGGPPCLAAVVGMMVLLMQVALPAMSAPSGEYFC